MYLFKHIEYILIRIPKIIFYRSDKLLLKTAQLLTVFDPYLDLKIQNNNFT